MVEGLSTTPQPDELSVMIGGREFRGFSSIRLTTSVDSFDSLSFVVPFDPGNRDHRDSFRPYSFKEVSAKIGGHEVFEGTMLTATPSFDSKKSSVEVTCYSKPAVIGDCVFPGGHTEFKGLDLKQLVEALVAPWGLEVEISCDVGPAFRSVTIERSGSVGGFIFDLAKQRGILVSNTTEGKILLHRPQETQPMHRFMLGEQPLVSVTPGSFSPQNYWSRINGFVPARSGRPGASYEVENPFLEILRPGAVDFGDTEDADCESATVSYLGRMIANSATYNITVPTWTWPNGRALITAGETVSLKADKAMIYNNYNFILRTVSFEGDSKKRSCSMNLVVPESYTGQRPRRLPWEE